MPNDPHTDGTPLKRIDKALSRTNAELEQEIANREQMHHLDTFFNVSLDMLCIVGVDGYFKQLNPAFEHTLGYTQDEFLAQPLLSFVYADDQNAMRTAIEQLATNTTTLRLENRCRHKDGSYRWLAWKGLLVGDTIYAIARDITENKESAEALRHSEERFRRVIESSPSAMLMVDQNGTIALVNSQTERIFGYAQEELIGQPVDMLISREVRGPHRSYMRDYFMKPEVRPMGKDRELHGIRKDGTEIPVEIALAPVEMPDGLYVLSAITDITERRKAQQDLRESKERFHLALLGVNAGIWDWANMQGDVVWWSPKFYELLGYTEGEVEPTMTNFVSLLHPDDRERTLALMEQHLQEHKPYRIDYRIRTKEGAYKWFSGSGQAQFGKDGQPTRMVGSIIDIHDQKTAEQALAQSNKELEQFAYVASHDLQEPLRTVTSFIELLKEEYQGQLDEEADEYIHFIVDGAQRMQMLIKDLLNYSRVGRHSLDSRRIDVNKVLKQVLNNLHARITKADAAISIGPLPTVEADAMQLGQVFQNLISNAIKFRSAQRPQITVSAEKRGAYWQFLVTDNGLGIKEEHWDRIFHVFKRLHSRRKFKGTGIGLAVCKKIIERHGGQIWVESEQGVGSTFYFTIPTTETA